MSWTSSTAVIGAGSNGVISTTSNNALIEADWNWTTTNSLEVYGANDTVIGGTGNDTITAVMYPALGMNGNNANIQGGYGVDLSIALAIQGEQNATLSGGEGIDAYTFGCNIDATLNAVINMDAWDIIMSLAIFYEGYQPGTFTCYSTDSGLILTDNAGRLNVKFNGVDYNSLANGQIWLCPNNVNHNIGFEAARMVWNSGSYVPFSSAVRYGGAITGLQLNGNTLTVDDWHSGGVVTNGVYGYDGIVVIDNTQSTQGRYLGGNSQANQIYAGAGGDTLWGAGNDDILIGGAGADIFMYGAGEGSDFVANADAFDTVNLYNLNLSDIAAVGAEAGTITLARDAADAVTVQYNGALSPTFALADGSRWQFNGASWQNA